VLAVLDKGRGPAGPAVGASGSGQFRTQALKQKAGETSSRITALPCANVARWLDANYLSVTQLEWYISTTVELISLTRCCPKNGDVPKSPLPRKMAA